jgi:membrane-associated phospholipid phosphatase
MLLQILNTLYEIDKAGLFFINKKLSHPMLDSVMLFLRNSTVWIPLYLFFLYLGIRLFKKKAWIWFLFAVMVVGVSDTVSSRLFKNFFERVRPCNDSTIKTDINILVSYIPKSYSFTSSHATNHFAIAIFMMLTLSPLINKHRYWLPCWAASICIAQVYVGVHYPFDVIGGAFLGGLIGYLLYIILNKILN